MGSIWGLKGVYQGGCYGGMLNADTHPLKGTLKGTCVTFKKANQETQNN